ncbi:hypothetical protein [Paenibacillus donghaensis]|uniref:Copper amine oxidase-like N-terminal domain-containing protein n=1 Tax=Paenibacillus donghaensis TaxID=414771 RepID=A0A2Z2KYA7_9BACL|nr:hypothetical protein [Paenibacillus donghaensis]ASA25428.1 hypothetical protein B9T62_34670 [Paenibacillus donghaensis]
MKKFVSGIIVGVMLFAGASAFAAPTSLIGQKVQGLFTVEKNGKKVADAVVINGSAYAPVRAVSDAAGVTLSLEGKKIIMEEKIPLTSESSPTATATPTTAEGLSAERELLVTAIDKKQAHVEEYRNHQVDFYTTLIKENPNSKSIPDWQAAEKKGNTRLEEIKAELTSLQQQLSDLDAQIAEVQK